MLAELELTVHRVVEKLLHMPTVRVKELAAEPGGDSYAEALRLLFNLGPDQTEAIAGLPAELPVGVELSVQLNGGAAGLYDRVESYDEAERYDGADTFDGTGGTA